MTVTPPVAPRAMTAQEAKAQAKAATAYAKSKRPFYKKKRYWILAVIVVIVIATVVGASSSKSKTPTSNNGVASNSNNGTHPPAADVTVTSCVYDATTTFATAKLTIVNHSSKQSNYLITVEFADSKGVQLGTNGANGGENVDPGQTALTESVDTLSAAPDKLTCKLKSVDRLAA